MSRRLIALNVLNWPITYTVESKYQYFVVETLENMNSNYKKQNNVSTSADFDVHWFVSDLITVENSFNGLFEVIILRVYFIGLDKTNKIKCYRLQKSSNNGCPFMQESKLVWFCMQKFLFSCNDMQISKL